MTAQYMDLLVDTFENVEGLNLDKLKKVTEETVALVRSLQEKLSSKDESSREEAKETAAELKQLVEQQMAKLAERGGMNYEDLMQLAQDPQFKVEAFAAMQKLERELISKEAPRRHITNNKTHLS